MGIFTRDKEGDLHFTNECNMSKFQNCILVSFQEKVLLGLGCEPTSFQLMSTSLGIDFFTGISTSLINQNVPIVRKYSGGGGGTLELLLNSFEATSVV